MNVSTLISAVSALIQNSTASSGPSVLSGKCPGTEGKKKWRWGNRDRVLGRGGDGELGRGSLIYTLCPLRYEFLQYGNQRPSLKTIRVVLSSG